MTDRFGRKGIIIFSLIATSFSTLLMGFVNGFQLFLVVAFISGIFTDVGGPAYEAVFMDVLPQEKRTSGFGIRRVAFNLAVVIGPLIGGFLAARSYLALFVIDAIVDARVMIDSPHDETGQVCCIEAGLGRSNCLWEAGF